MKFTALPVKCGDSFLLECDGKRILVDGGKDSVHIIQLLDNEQIPHNHIDLLICTHYDSDHINGIVGVLKSNKYSFKEVWLPEILGSIANTYSKKHRDIFKYLEGLNDLKEIKDFKNITDNLNEEIKDNTDDSYELIDNQFLSSFLESYHHRYNFNNILYHHRHLDDNELFYKMSTNLFQIMKLINSSLNSGSYIRWLKFENNVTNKTYGYDMYAQNSIQTKITEFKPIEFFKALYYVTKINKESLVFKFDNNECPNVLFTADSDFNFCNNSISLSDNSVVTAPHHGSVSNDNVYSKIIGNNLTFVRSDNSQVKRPGIGFLNQTKRYCTICRNLNQKQKVELNLSNGQFTTNANICIC